VAAYLNGIVDEVAGDPPVPITVWRAVAADDPNAAAPGRLTPWLARRLVATYSRRGGTVVDLDADPPLRHAATAGGRGYLPVTRPADLAGLDSSGDVDLITMRWPRPDPVPATAVVDLFHACRLVLGRRGHAAVIVDPPPGTPYLEFGHELVPAAARAGMGYLQHIIAILAPIVGDTITAPTPDSQAYQVATANGIHVKIHLDMLIFVVGGPDAS
jgi:hypothetical protein